MRGSLPLKSLRVGAAGLCTLVLFSNLPVAAEESCPPAAALQGSAWTEQDGAGQILFEQDQVVVREKGHLRAASILRRGLCTLTVRDEGVLSTWTLSGDGHALRLARGKGTVVLGRLAQTPSDLDISPLPQPQPGPVPADTVQAVAAELRARSAQDQATLADKAKRAAVVADNIRYLREVVGRYGWIDISRFGKAAAAAAIFIAKHADDVRLMQDALPIAEQDAKEKGGGKEIVSVLVDAVLITTGHKQKYGTQIDEDEHGRPFVIPVEDLTKVDEYRKELGILPWSEYLKKASQALYAGAPIRIPGPEE